MVRSEKCKVQSAKWKNEKAARRCSVRVSLHFALCTDHFSLVTTPLFHVVHVAAPAVRAIFGKHSAASSTSETSIATRNTRQIS